MAQAIKTRNEGKLSVRAELAQFLNVEVQEVHKMPAESFVKGLIHMQRSKHVEAEEKRRARNAATLEKSKFLRACESAKIPPTKRQARKWNNKKGLAYRTRTATGS